MDAMSPVGLGPGGPRSAPYQCPCCDHFTLPARADYDICPVCFWEDDGLDLDRLDVHSGPNHLTLREGRANFEDLGACCAADLKHVVPMELRDRYHRVRR